MCVCRRRDGEWTGDGWTAWFGVLHFVLYVCLSLYHIRSLSLSLTLSLSLHSLPFYFFAIFILLSVCVIELNVGHWSVVACAVSVREIIGAERQTK
jgi:hypothetical protein